MSNTMKLKTAPPDVDALLDEAAMPERSVELCLRGDLYAAWQAKDAELTNEIMHAESLGEPDHITALRGEVKALEEQMRAATLTVLLRAVPKETFDQLLLANPPRDENQQDQIAGFNRDALNNDLIRACIIEPEMTDERWGKLTRKITSHQYQELLDAANAVNFNPVDVPFSFAASAKQSVSDAS